MTSPDEYPAAADETERPDRAPVASPIPAAAAVTDAAAAMDAAPITDAAPTADVSLDELAVLDHLEADLTAVELAITTLDQISSDGAGGDQAAAEISAAVSVERFGVASPG